MKIYLLCLDFSFLAMLILTPWVLPARSREATFGVVINPSSVVLQVGERVEINITISNPEQVSGGQVCFGLDGFPASGFRTSLNPGCSGSRNGQYGAVLTVETTPAAAGQTVKAYVTATDGNQTAQAVLNLTVESASQIDALASRTILVWRSDISILVGMALGLLVSVPIVIFRFRRLRA